jgi:hypothetical protein
MNWRIHPAAQQELDDCLEWYAGIDPELALAKRRPHYLRTRLADMKKPS